MTTGQLHGTPDLAAPRSPQVPARRRGRNWEKIGWLYMRISGVLLVILIFGHLFFNLMLGDGIHGIDWGFVAGKLANPFWQWWDILLLWLALIHGANGMRTIVNDYVTGQTARRVLIWALWWPRAAHPPGHARGVRLRPLQRGHVGQHLLGAVPEPARTPHLTEQTET